MPVITLQCRQFLDPEDIIKKKVSYCVKSSKPETFVKCDRHPKAIFSTRSSP